MVELIHRLTTGAFERRMTFGVVVRKSTCPFTRNSIWEGVWIGFLGALTTIDAYSNGDDRGRSKTLKHVMFV